MKRELALILDECLAQMRAGVRIQDCLARYPSIGTNSLRLGAAAAVQMAPGREPAGGYRGRRRENDGGRIQEIGLSTVTSGRLSRYAGRYWIRSWKGESENETGSTFSMSILIAVLVVEEAASPSLQPTRFRETCSIRSSEAQRTCDCS